MVFIKINFRQSGEVLINFFFHFLTEWRAYLLFCFARAPCENRISAAEMDFCSGANLNFEPDFGSVAQFQICIYNNVIYTLFGL